MSAFHRPARPRTVTITLWGVFLLGAWNAARAITLGRQIDLFQDLGAVPSPRFRMVIALIWATSFWTLTIMLRRRRPLVRQAVPILMVLYALTELALLVFFVQSPAAQRTWLPNSIFYVVMTTFSYWALNRSAADSYFETG